MKVFTTGFGSYVHDGLSLSATYEGFTLTATLVQDCDSSPPWKQGDGHGPVTEWTRDEPTEDQRVLNTDRGSHRLYDFGAAVEIAMREGWGVSGGKLEGETDRDYAVRAAELDFRAMKSWCDGEWHYFGVVVKAAKAGIDLGDASVWGVEGNYPDGDNSYLLDCANDLADDAVAEANTKLKELLA